MSISHKNGSEYKKNYVYLENAEVDIESILFNNMAAEYSSCHNLPHLKVLVQPIEKFRYRYGSEKGSHGTLKGVKVKGKKSNLVSVKLENFVQDRLIEVRASLYTNETAPRPHVLELVGKSCKDGVCAADLSANNIAEFKSFSIRMFKKENVTDNILKRKISVLYGKSRKKIDQRTLHKLEEEAQMEGADLYSKRNCCRLFFEAFDKELNQPIGEGVFSNVIENQKTDSNLKIHRITPCSGKSTGGEDVILLCDKIKKDDTEVRFFEVDKNGDTIWEENADFDSANVHHQVAIPFRTPKFRENISAVVFIQLVTKDLKEAGNCVKFQFKIDEFDVSRINKKRKMHDIPCEGEPVCKGRQITSVSTPVRNLNLSESSSSDYGTVESDLSPSSRVDEDDAVQLAESLINNRQLPDTPSNGFNYLEASTPSPLWDSDLYCYDHEQPFDEIDQASFFNADQMQSFNVDQLQSFNIYQPQSFNVDKPQSFNVDQPQPINTNQVQSLYTESDVLTDAIVINHPHSMQADANLTDPDPFLWSSPRSRIGRRSVMFESGSIEYQSGHNTVTAVRTSAQLTISEMFKQSPLFLLFLPLMVAESVKSFCKKLFAKFYPKLLRFTYLMSYRLRRLRISLGVTWPRIYWNMHRFAWWTTHMFQSLMKRNSVNNRNFSDKSCQTVFLKDDAEQWIEGWNLKNDWRSKEPKCLDYSTYNDRFSLKICKDSSSKKTVEQILRIAPEKSIHSENIIEVKKESQGLNFKDVESNLCNYMNVDSRWKKLALFVDLNRSMVDTLAELSSSPMRTILTMLKNTYGENYKIALTNALEKTDFDEAVQMLKSF